MFVEERIRMKICWCQGTGFGQTLLAKSINTKLIIYINQKKSKKHISLRHILRNVFFATIYQIYQCSRIENWMKS